MSDQLPKVPSIDRTIHEPARLLIMAILSAADEADFQYLLGATGLRKGNLSSHLSRLEKEAYIEIEKSFIGKTPRTICRLTADGLEALELYRRQMKALL